MLPCNRCTSRVDFETNSTNHGFKVYLEDLVVSTRNMTIQDKQSMAGEHNDTNANDALSTFHPS